MADKQKSDAKSQPSENSNRETAPSDMNNRSEADVAATRTQDGTAVTTKTVYETKDGTPVEPASIPAKEPFGPTPDVSKRPDVVEKTVGLDEHGNEVSRS